MTDNSLQTPTGPENDPEDQLLAAAFRHLWSGVVITDPHQRDNPIIYVNSAFSQLTGYSAAEAIGRNCRFLQGTGSCADEKSVRAIREALENELPFRGLVQNYRKDGSPFSNALSIIPMRNQAGEVTHFLGSLNDVSTSREQLRALAGHATRAREAERTCIAREIHDELGQALTSLKIDLSRMDRRLKAWFDQQQTASAQSNGEASLQSSLQSSGAASFGDELHQSARAMIALTEDTIHTVRRIATQLRPSLLDDLGLEAAAEWQVKDFAARTGIACHFKSTLGDQEFPSALATAGFRILQESLTNVARHAQATKVRVRLDRHREELRLEVRDNGQGIKAQTLGNVRSLGLLGMRERALGLGGTVEFVANKPKGTRVTAHLPLNYVPTEEALL